jgi:protein-S-isoprenylcysteine O-methyltransferase Ste14
MKPAFAEFGAGGMLSALFALSAAVWLATEVMQALRARPTAANSDRSSLLVVRVCMVCGVFVAEFALRFPAAALPASPVLFGLSLSVLWCGIGLRWWSFRTLGRYFTFNVMTSPDQPVINAGPYRMLRHPGYTGLLLALLGVGLAFGNWLSLAGLMVFAAIGLLNRIRVEEGALSTALGERYADFARTRKRLIPYVW